MTDRIQFIGFTPDRHDKFVTFVMLMVGSLVEATWLISDMGVDTVRTEVILIAGASEEDGLYFSRNLEAGKYEWIFKKKAKEKSFGSYYRLHWDRIVSLVYIGAFEDHVAQA